MNVIMTTLYGSKLYGTSDENSDTDYKSIYIPTKEQIILGYDESFNKNTGSNGSKNTNGDIDHEFHSLKKFISLLCSGDNNAIDMLHSRGEPLIHTSPEFEYLYENRKDFYTAKMAGMIGFCTSHYHKFDRKADRYDALNFVYDVLDKLNKSDRVKDHLNVLPSSEFSYLTDPNDDINQMVYYNVLGSKHMITVSVGELKDSIERKLKIYGNRTKTLSTTGTEWKSLYSTIRVMLETIEIYETNDLVFPSKHAEYLLSIKQGKADRYEVERHMNVLMNQINSLIASSKLQKSVDRTKWNKFIVDIYSKQFKIN